MTVSQALDLRPDPAQADAGRVSLRAAAAAMPVLHGLTAALAETRPLAGHRVAGCVHLTKETGILIRALLGAGAEVAWTGGDEVSTQDAVAAALADEGVAVYARAGITTAAVGEGIESVLDFFDPPPTLLLDNGGRLISAALDGPARRRAALRGATEKTTEGVRMLRARGGLPVPVIAVNDAITKLEVDNTYGTGQSTVDGILRATGRLIAGTVFVVVGFGHVGRGVALRARGLGARVVIVCRSQRTAVRARLAGYEVMSMAGAARVGDVFCTATGYDGVIRAEHLELMRDRATLCNTGRSVTEVDIRALRALAVGSEQVRPHVTRYELADGRRLDLLADGGLVNLAAGEGNPSEVMDLTFAHQMLAVLRLADQADMLGPGLHEVPPEDDERVAALKLAQLGIRHDRPGPTQRAHVPVAVLSADDREDHHG